MRHRLVAVVTMTVIAAPLAATAAHADGDYVNDGTWEQKTHAPLVDPKKDAPKGADITEIIVVENQGLDFPMEGSYGYYLVTANGRFNDASRFAWYGTGETATGTADTIRWWKNTKGRFKFTVDGLSLYKNRCTLGQVITLQSWTKTTVTVRIPYECAEPDNSYIPKDKRYFTVQDGDRFDRTKKKTFDWQQSNGL